MAATLGSITLNSNQWTNVYQMTGIAVGTKIAIQNVGSSDVYLTSSLNQPELDSDSFQVIQANNFPLSNSCSDIGAWAMSPNQNAKINVWAVM